MTKEMPEKECPKCGTWLVAEDLDRPAFFYYCFDCGYEECDTAGWSERMTDHADFLRMQKKDCGI